MTGGTPALGLVVGRELRESSRRKSLWITFLVVLVGSTALVVLPEVLGGSDTRSVVTTGPVSAAFESGVQQAARSVGLDVTTNDAVDGAALESSVSDGDADVGIDFTTDPPTVIVEAGADTELGAIAQQVVAQSMLRDQLDAEGLSPEQVTTVFSDAQPNVNELGADEGGRSTVAFMASLVLYLLLVLLTSAVASGVAIEKSKRISEVLLAIVKPPSLLYGKIIGVGLIGIVTLLVGALPVVVKILIGGDLPPDTGTTLAASAAWFVLGIALYLTAAGGLGALVDRQEQVGSMVVPLSIILVAGYVVGISAADSSLGAVLAVVPFTSPMVMPARLALGVAGPTEVLVSLVVLTVTVVLVARLATVVYERAIVRTGRRLTLREVLRPAT